MPKRSRINSLLLRSEHLQNAGGPVSNVGVHDAVHRRANPLVLDQISERRLAVTPHRCLERDRGSGNGFQLLNLLHREIYSPADVIVRRRAAELLLKLTRWPGQTCSCSRSCEPEYGWSWIGRQSLA